MNAPDDTRDLDLAVKRYEGLVRRLAYSLVRKVPASVEFDELFQAGRIAVWQSYPRFDPSKGVQIETFLTRRIIGGLIDFLRSTDYLSRQDRRAVKKLNRCMNGYSRISRTELAALMEIDFVELERLLLLREGDPVSGDESRFEGGETLFERTSAAWGDPVDAIRTSECLMSIEKSVEKCSPGDSEITKQIFQQHFIEGRDLEEIGEFLGVTASRVCQLAERLRNVIEYRLRYS